MSGLFEGCGLSLPALSAVAAISTPSSTVQSPLHAAAAATVESGSGNMSGGGPSFSSSYPILPMLHNRSIPSPSHLQQGRSIEGTVKRQLLVVQQSLASQLAETSDLLDGHFEEHRRLVTELQLLRTENQSLRGAGGGQFRSESSSDQVAPRRRISTSSSLQHAREAKEKENGPEQQEQFEESLENGEERPSQTGCPSPPRRKSFGSTWPAPPNDRPVKLVSESGEEDPNDTYRKGSTASTSDTPAPPEPVTFKHIQGPAAAIANRLRLAAQARAGSKESTNTGTGSQSPIPIPATELPGCLRPSDDSEGLGLDDDEDEAIPRTPPLPMERASSFEKAGSDNSDSESSLGVDAGRLSVSSKLRLSAQTSSSAALELQERDRLSELPFRGSSSQTVLPLTIDRKAKTISFDFDEGLQVPSGQGQLALPQEEEEEDVKPQLSSLGKLFQARVHLAVSQQKAKNAAAELMHEDIVGRWVDSTGAFFDGKVINISKAGWYAEGNDEADVTKVIHKWETNPADIKTKVLIDSSMGKRLQRRFFVQEVTEPGSQRTLLMTGPGLGYGVWLQFVGRQSSQYQKEEVVGDFQLLDVWERISKMTSDTSPGDASSANNRRRASANNGMDLEENGNGKGEKGGSMCVIHPFSTRRAIWDVISFVFVIWDVLTIPMQAFDPPDVAFTQVMTQITRIFWTVDLNLAFFRGYVLSSGQLELRLSRAVRNYLKTWFLCDVTMVMVDWAEIFLETSGEGLDVAKIGRASRSVRIFRVIRLLRVLRMREVMSFVLECVSSQKVVIVIDIVKLLLFLLAMGHILACAWYAVSINQISEEATWIRVYGFETRSLWSRYLISLHWSLSQFAGGMDEVTPENVQERGLAIFVFLLGFVASTAFVSSLTSSVTQVMIIGGQSSQQQAALREYLSQNGVSRRLMVRAQRNAAHALREQASRMPEESVALLKSISEPLRIELHKEMYGPTLKLHKFFMDFSFFCPHIMGRVCHQATTRVLVSKGDVVFYGGEKPQHPRMYFVEHGSLTYIGRNDTMMVGEKRWLSEGTLWTHWEHRGTLIASSQCRLCTVSAAKFQEAILTFGSMADIPTQRGRAFVSFLNSQPDVNDLVTDIVENTRGSFADPDMYPGDMSLGRKSISSGATMSGGPSSLGGSSQERTTRYSRRASFLSRHGVSIREEADTPSGARQTIQRLRKVLSFRRTDTGGSQSRLSVRSTER